MKKFRKQPAAVSKKLDKAARKAIEDTTKSSTKPVKSHSPNYFSSKSAAPGHSKKECSMSIRSDFPQRGQACVSWIVFTTSPKISRHTPCHSSLAVLHWHPCSISFRGLHGLCLAMFFSGHLTAHSSLKLPECNLDFRHHTLHSVEQCIHCLVILHQRAHCCQAKIL